jgi:hypothetical protein
MALPATLGGSSWVVSFVNFHLIRFQSPKGLLQFKVDQLGRIMVPTD